MGTTCHHSRLIHGLAADRQKVKQIRVCAPKPFQFGLAFSFPNPSILSYALQYAAHFLHNHSWPLQIFPWKRYRTQIRTSTIGPARHILHLQHHSNADHYRHIYSDTPTFHDSELNHPITHTSGKTFRFEQLLGGITSATIISTTAVMPTARE